MRRLLIAFILLVAPLTCLAQSNWLISYEDAVAVSKKTHRPILAFFTGSDWCGWCKRLNSEVFSTSLFQQWASQKVVLLELDFPHNIQQSPALKQQNSQLQSKFHITGYPTVHMLNAKGESMANQGYEAGGPEKWIQNISSKVDAWMLRHPEPVVDVTKAYEGVPYVDKKLYASVDVRGKLAPELKVEKWLSSKRPYDIAGKVVILVLWQTVSQHSRDLIPDLNACVKEFKDDVVVIAVSDEDPQDVKAFMKDNKMNSFVGVDTKSRMFKALGVTDIPHVLVVSPDGLVRWQGFPTAKEDPLTREKLIKILTAAYASTKN